MEDGRFARPVLPKIFVPSFVDNGVTGSTNHQYRRGGLTKMQYLLLIYGNESQFDQMSPTEQNKILLEYGEFSKSIAGSGHMRGGNELDRISKAKTVRVRQGKRSVLDGPFAETKEQLGGYYLVEAKDVEEALALAARIPSARWGSIEIRPIIPHEMPS
jgi:hypothetical protein